MTQPKYRFIADEIRSKINSGVWQDGFQIPSETELAVQYAASRMTARKAVDELVNAGLLERTPSVGTFVRSFGSQSSLLEVRNIADEIKARGHQHKMTVLSKLTLVPNEQVAFPFPLHSKQLFKIVIVHWEDEHPIQLEERYVNAEQVPAFFQQDFSQITASAYLNAVAPLSEAEITVDAVMPTKILKHHLHLDDETPCLRVTRITYSLGTPISYALLYHPANRFKLKGHLNLTK